MVPVILIDHHLCLVCSLTAPKLMPRFSNTPKSLTCLLEVYIALFDFWTATNTRVCL